MMQATFSWLKRLMKRLAAFLLSGVAAAIVALLAILPFLFLFKWLFGPIPSGGLPSLIDGWYVWGLIIVWFVLFFYLDRRFDKWLVRRFGLSRKAGLKYGGDDG